MLRKSNHSITWSIFMIETWCKLHFAKSIDLRKFGYFLGIEIRDDHSTKARGLLVKSPMPVQTRGCTVRILNLTSQLVDVMTVWKLGISAPWGCFGHTNSCFKSMQICETGAQRATKNWHWADISGWQAVASQSGDECTNNQEMHIWYPNRKTVKLTDLHKFGIGQKACCPAISPFKQPYPGIPLFVGKSLRKDVYWWFGAWGHETSVGSHPAGGGWEGYGRSFFVVCLCLLMLI